MTDVSVEHSARAREQGGDRHVHDASPTVLHPNPISTVPASSGTAGHSRLEPQQATGRPTPSPRGVGVVNLGNHGTETAARAGRADEPGASAPGQAFADLLLVGSTAARCPLALVTVNNNGSWSTLSFGADREALEDPELFSIITGRREPVEVTEPSSNPALSRTRLARSSLGIRWLLGVPLIGPTGAVDAIFAVLDTTPRELSRRERAAVVAVGRLVAGALSAHRAPEHAGPSPAVPERPHGAKKAADAHTLLRSHEVAAMFDVTERTVINWAASGKLPCLRTVGGHLRFRSEDVITLLEASSLGRARS
ncbi:MAG: helix-turn-helix domain-containing protein [Acidimicrobiales bacterium]